jgi:hypothetical protein
MPVQLFNRSEFVFRQWTPTDCAKMTLPGVLLCEERRRLLAKPCGGLFLTSHTYRSIALMDIANVQTVIRSVKTELVSFSSAWCLQFWPPKTPRLVRSQPVHTSI